MIKVYLCLCFCGLVASDNEATTIATTTTKTATATLKLGQNITESTSQITLENLAEITTLPSLPDEGRAKSRRKPGFRSEEETPLKPEGENVKDDSFDDDKIKGMDIKKDGKSKLSKKKVSLKEQSHGKKEIRLEDEIDKTDNTKLLDTNKNETSDDKTIKESKKTTEMPWPTFDKKEINKTLSNNKEEKDEVQRTPIPKSTTDAPFKIGSSVVKIVPLKQDSKPISSTTTSKSTLQNVELPKPVSVGLDTSPSAIPSPDSKPSNIKSEPIKENNGSTGLIVGIFFGMVLTSVLVFVGLKRLDAIRRRREYRRMNDFLIDGMYNDA